MGKGAVIALILVVIIAVGGVYAYLNLVHGKEGPTPSPTPSPKPTRPPKSPKPPKPTPKPTPSPSPSPTPSPGKVSLSDFFNLAGISHYTYKITTEAQGQTAEMTISYSISSTTLSGKSCWLQEIETKSQGVTMKYRVWLDKATLKCLKAEVSINNGPWQSTSCSQAPSGTAEGEVQVREAGHETVTVPAGTFSCTIYEATVAAGSARYWVSDQVPIPVKWEISSRQSKITAELLEWG